MNASTCKHYTGTYHNTHCEAGVCYRDVTTDPNVLEGSAFRKPCIDHEADKQYEMTELQRENYDRRGTCDKFELPSSEELAEYKVKSDARHVEVMESLARGVVPDGIFVCGPGTVGKCVCKCPESCGHVWDGPTVEFEEDGLETKTCSICGKWAINHDMWV